MEFKQLRSFIEVVHRGGFTQAAQTLHISQSAVSKQVAQLEQDVGQPLLERQASQLHLTAAGRIVLERGEALLRQRQALLSELDDLSQMGRGELRLGLPMLGSDALFAGLFAEYRRRHPNITVQLLEGGSRSVEQAAASPPLTKPSTISRSATSRWMPCYRPATGWWARTGWTCSSWLIPRFCFTSAASCSMTGY